MPAIQADFTQPALVTPDTHHWVPSPGGEVERVMLDRVGDEVAVATSLVRYPPDSAFPPHQHGLGEEFLVLSGELADERGRYPPGTYVRNPPGSRHTPFSDPGCVIWVKLRQFHPDDDRQVIAKIDHLKPGDTPQTRELHRFQDEVVTAVAAAADVMVEPPAAEVVQELLVVEGRVDWQGHILDAWSWLRLPAGQGMRLRTLTPCRLLHKTRPPFAIPAFSSATTAASAGT